MTRRDTTAHLLRRRLASGAALTALAVLAACSSSDSDPVPTPIDDGVATSPGDAGSASGTGAETDTGVVAGAEDGSGVGTDAGVGTGADTGDGVDAGASTDGGTGTGDTGTGTPPVIEPAGSVIATDANALLAFLLNPPIESGAGLPDSDDADVVDGGLLDTFNAWSCRTDGGIVEFAFEPSDPEDTDQTLASSSGTRYDAARDYWAVFFVDGAGNDSVMYRTVNGVRERDLAVGEMLTGELTTVRTGPGRAWSAFDSIARSALSCTETEVSRALF